MTRQSTTGPLAIGALRTRTRLTALTAVLCASAALAGCSSGNDTTTAESTAPTLTASAAPLSTAPADPEAAAKKTALEVYCLRHSRQIPSPSRTAVWAHTVQAPRVVCR
ncbi:hypothetical protein [Streptomyces rishiriensis]|uniref:Outer membrane murein-binding lipoprotein Lpp n=1 Tax=Streptomyces rishiriensis TaxID=68264 RepID=A0ABU0NGG3_STRRH|nr:hypothetical protein [Streptomyces rishiriensis]MDQ0577853.1 outer membrane murein-binding lipoprotein Lpp [Streptomyces rishiriensis]